ncbi:hypothetical protein T492DRAFT_841071 [Pavlovales sp. CCMP2436]|nr:hypothetical protein T492DRAFT_841071 [Pavlovales sp. CCMP2436]
MSYPGRASMLHVVEPPAHARNPPHTTRARAQAGKSVDVDTLLAKLLERVLKRRLRLKERFVEFDQLRSGSVSSHKFRTALCVAGLDDLSSRELAALEAKFEGATRGTVRYIVLVNYLEQTAPGMERTPMASVPTLAASVRKPLPTLSLELEAEVEHILERIRAQVSINRLEVRQPFDDFAHNDNSAKMIHRVTRAQFRQVLGRLHVELTNEEAELLAAKLDTHKDGSVNYVEFSVLVDPSVAAALPPAFGGLSDADRMRSNKISIPSFRTALSVAFDRLSVEVTEGEFHLLCKK